MTVPRYRYRVIAFDSGGDWRVRVERFVDSSLRDRRAAVLAAEGKMVLVCEVLDVLGGGDEGALVEPPRPRKRR